MTVITIDRGNTSNKIAVMKDGSMLDMMRLEQSWSAVLPPLCHQYSVEAILISSVAAEDAELESVLADLALPVKRLTWQSPEAHTLMRNIPEGLGADRLAADIGAIAIAGNVPLLIVDAGTCLTFDVISADGECVGGTISPGVALRLRAMHEHTALLPLLTPEGDAPEIGTDTETAMRGGAVNGTKWEIEGYIRMLREKYGDALRVFMTGGNDFRFSADIAVLITHEPALIHHGLWSIYMTPPLTPPEGGELDD